MLRFGRATEFFCAFFSADKFAAFATGLFIEVDILDFHAFVDGFAHIVDGQQGNADGMKCFHFDSGLAGYLDGRFGLNGAFAGQHREVNTAFGNGQWMAERDDRTRGFGGHDAGDAGDAEHIAFFAVPCSMAS